jgi:hypothetical protein
MATTRLLKRKRVPILSNDSDQLYEDFVDIPVIAEMSFIGSGGQEFRYRFTNDSTTQLRTVRIKKVGAAQGEFGSATVSFDNFINAERIQTIAFSNPVEMITFMGKPVLYNQSWRTDKKFKNQDPAPKQPDGSDDPRHLQVHYVRYYKNNDLDSQIWVDVEIIDKLELIATNAQAYIYKIKHPTADEYAEMASDDRFGQPAPSDHDPYQPIIGFCDPSLDLLDIEIGEDGTPLPVRLDPFQNIVNLHREISTGIVEQIFVFRRYGESCVASNLGVLGHSGGGDWYPVSHEQWIEWSSHGLTSPQDFEGTGQAGSSIFRMETIATRDKLSDLIAACVTLSEQLDQNPGASDGLGGRNPWWSWLVYSGQPSLSCDAGLINPMPVEQPNAANASHMIEDSNHPGNLIPHWIYLGAKGYAQDDDLAAGEDGVPPGYPPFIPPT